MRTIMHIDLDAFFAACEQREHPEYTDKPVVVGADPRNGTGRGVVSTASYEARKYGIKSAMPISKAFQLCPTAIFVRPHFSIYKQASHNVMEIIREYADTFQPVSIDEAYIDVTGRIEDGEQAKDIAAQIRARVFESEKLTCSVGIAQNKLVAKIASEFNKPDGVKIVEAGSEKAFLAPLSVRQLPGVGPKTGERLVKMGIKLVRDLQEVSIVRLQDMYGSYGLVLRRMAHGVDDSIVKRRGAPKSISRHDTFGADVAIDDDVLKKIDALVSKACKGLDRGSLACKTIGIRVRFADFETHTRETTLPTGTNEPDVLMKTAHDLFSFYSNDSRMIRLVGIRLSHLFTIKTQKLITQFV